MHTDTDIDITESTRLKSNDTEDTSIEIRMRRSIKAHSKYTVCEFLIDLLTTDHELGVVYSNTKNHQKI